MGTPRWADRTPEPDQRRPARPARPDIVVVGGAEEPPIQTSFDLHLDTPPDDPLAARIAPVLRALDRGVEQTRRQSEAHARRIVASARDEAERIREGIEDELVVAHLGLEQLRARRDEVIRELRELYDLVASTSERLAVDAPGDEEPADAETLPPPPNVA